MLAGKGTPATVLDDRLAEAGRLDQDFNHWAID
jgi:hypothetical protein